MPTDFQNLVYTVAITLQNNGVQAYNAAVAAGTVVGSQIRLTNQLDDRPGAGAQPGRVVARLSGRAPADFPRIRLQLKGGYTGETTTRTFAYQQGVACDAIIPKTFQLTQTITYDGPKDSMKHRWRGIWKRPWGSRLFADCYLRYGKCRHLLRDPKSLSTAKTERSTNKKSSSNCGCTSLLPNSPLSPTPT